MKAYAIEGRAGAHASISVEIDETVYATPRRSKHVSEEVNRVSTLETERKDWTDTQHKLADAFCRRGV